MPRRSPVARLAATSFADIIRAERTMPRDWLGVVTGVGAVRQSEDLHLPCSLVTLDQRAWVQIWGTDDTVAAHEVLHGAEAARSEYNHRCLTQVQRTGRALVATHGGFSDAFVPVHYRGQVRGFLVSGSFATSPWRASQIREAWQRLTRRLARANDPEMLSYAQAVLATPVLPRPMARAYVAMLSELARILGDSKRILPGRARLHSFAQHHFHRRLHFNMWQMAAGLVDPVQQGAWTAMRRGWIRRFLGLTRLPTVIVALRCGGSRGRDALEALVEDHRFVVHCADTALELEDAACGRAGRSAAYFLFHCDPSFPDRVGRRAVVRWVDDLRSRLRRKGHAQVHVGASTRTPVPTGLGRCLREALVALEWAVHRDEPLVFYEDHPKEVAAGPARFRALPDLLRSLREGAPREASIAVEELLSEIVWQSAANVTSARAYVDAFYSQALREVSDLDLLEPMMVADRLSRFQEAIEQATTVNATVSAFREHTLVLIGARTETRNDRRDAKLDRILSYLEAHVAEDVKLSQAAKMAGYAPRYFSSLLYRLRGQTFERLMLSLRLARATELLRSSELVVAEVARATGFRSLAYFHRAFLKEVGRTPAAFRAEQRRTRWTRRRSRDRARDRALWS